MLEILLYIVNFLTIFVPILLCVAFLTLAERRVMGNMQNRRGPNVVGFFGLLQPIADGVKLLIKEPIVPLRADSFIFIFAPIFTFSLSLVNWGVISLVQSPLEFDLGLLIVLGFSSLTVYGIILAGWSSNSKYAFIGGLRSAAQMISYEVSLSITLLPIVCITGSLCFSDIVELQSSCGWFIIPLFPAAGIFFVTMLAETARTPFDLPEAEGELVAGYNVEYAGFMFALFFLAEYANIILMSVLFSILFLGGWTDGSEFGIISFCMKVMGLMFAFIWVRATLPRYRYDQLMRIGWKVFLPFTVGYFCLISGLVFLVWLFLLETTVSQVGDGLLLIG